MSDTLKPTTANQSWMRLIRDIRGKGIEANPRSIGTKEILGYQSKIDMNYPIVTVPQRVSAARHFHAFMFAEAYWILSGQNRVDYMGKFSSAISRFSDDGQFFRGAYGPKIVDQLTYVADCLDADPMSRQAVLNIWRENPRNSRDIPCTLSAQFLIRDGKLHCMHTMRSSDAWLGWPFDVFNFSMLSWSVLNLLRSREGSKTDAAALELGTLHLTAGSQHLYDSNSAAVDELVKNYDWRMSPSYKLSTHLSQGVFKHQRVIDFLMLKASGLHEFKTANPLELFEPMFTLVEE